MEQYVKGFKGFTPVKMCGLSPLASFYFSNYGFLGVADHQMTSPLACCHRELAQSVCVADCYFIVNVLALPFASPIAICR